MALRDIDWIRATPIWASLTLLLSMWLVFLLPSWNMALTHWLGFSQDQITLSLELQLATAVNAGIFSLLPASLACERVGPMAGALGCATLTTLGWALFALGSIGAVEYSRSWLTVYLYLTGAGSGAAFATAMHVVACNVRSEAVIEAVGVLSSCFFYQSIVYTAITQTVFSGNVYYDWIMPVRHLICAGVAFLCAPALFVIPSRGSAGGEGDRVGADTFLARPLSAAIVIGVLLAAGPWLIRAGNYNNSMPTFYIAWTGRIFVSVCWFAAVFATVALTACLAHRYGARALLSLRGPLGHKLLDGGAPAADKEVQRQPAEDSASFLADSEPAALYVRAARETSFWSMWVSQGVGFFACTIVANYLLTLVNAEGAVDDDTDDGFSVLSYAHIKDSVTALHWGIKTLAPLFWSHAVARWEAGGAPDARRTPLALLGANSLLMAAALVLFLICPVRWVYLPTALSALAIGGYYTLPPLVLVHWHGAGALGAVWGTLMLSGLAAQLPQALILSDASSCKGDMGCFIGSFLSLAVLLCCTGAWALRHQRVPRSG